MLTLQAGCALSSLAHSSPRTSVPVSDERTRSFLDTSDNTSHILHQGRGRSSAPSVKELTALYLSQTAAAAAHAGSPTQPVSTARRRRPPPHKSPAASQQCPVPASGCKRVRENTSGFINLEKHSIWFSKNDQLSLVICKYCINVIRGVDLYVYDV